MSRRAAWTWAVLTAPALALVLECWAAWDGDADTRPWTDLITTYVPWEVCALVLGGLVGWLPAHLGWRYWRRWQTQHGQDE